MNTKIKLNRLFKELRKQGYFARQNFWCCDTCATSEIYKEKDYVFYNQQAGDRLKRCGDRVMIAFRGDATEICNIARKEGFITNWNGDLMTKIELINEVEK